MFPMFPLAEQLRGITTDIAGNMGGEHAGEHVRHVPPRSPLGRERGSVRVSPSQRVAE